MITAEPNTASGSAAEQSNASAGDSGHSDLFNQAVGQIQRGDLKAAQETLEQLLEVEPQSIQALVYLGMAAMPRDFEKAGRALDKALALDSSDPGALYWASEVKWLQCDWLPAISFAERLAHLYPAPQNWGRLGFVCKDAGQVHKATEAFLRASSSLATAGSSEKEKGRDLFYIAQAGDVKKFNEELSSTCGLVADPDLPPGVRSLRNQLEGKDLAILATGPSLGLLEDYVAVVDSAKRHEMKYFGFNNAPVAQNLLRELGVAGLDVVLMSHPQVVKLHEEWLLQFLDEPKNTFFVVDGALSESPALQVRSGDKPQQFVYYQSAGDYPPVPSDPLHFPPINSLMHVLPLAMLGRPRAIFLFGCDAGVTNKCYFREGDSAYGNQQKPEHSYGPWIRKDAFLFDCMIDTLLKTLSRVWRVGIPPIYNCSPDSRLTAFPRVTANEFRSLVHSNFREVEPLVGQ